MVAANIASRPNGSALITAENDLLFRKFNEVRNGSQLLEAADEAARRGVIPTGNFLVAAKNAGKLSSDEVKVILNVLASRQIPGAAHIIPMLEDWTTRATFCGPTECPGLRRQTWNANSPSLPPRGTLK